MFRIALPSPTCLSLPNHLMICITCSPSPSIQPSHTSTASSHKISQALQGFAQIPCLHRTANSPVKPQLGCAFTCLWCSSRSFSKCQVVHPFMSFAFLTSEEKFAFTGCHVSISPVPLAGQRVTRGHQVSTALWFQHGKVNTSAAPNSLELPPPCRSLALGQGHRAGQHSGGGRDLSSSQLPKGKENLERRCSAVPCPDHI